MTNSPVTHADLLPKKVGRQTALDYILDRTLLRPRDIIHFFNICITQAAGKATIPLRALREAEGIYSRERLRALADEWYGIYPNLLHLTKLLKRKPDIFKVEDFDLGDIETNYIELLISGQGENGLDLQMMNIVSEGAMSPSEYRVNLVIIFYKVGLVGLKTDSFSPISWTDSGGVSVSRAEVDNETKVAIHKTFWRCLGIPETGGENNVIGGTD